MTDADIYKEVAEEAVRSQPISGIILNDMILKPSDNMFIAREAPYSRDLLCMHADLAECVRIARAKLQAERDAKDAPRLREENERYEAALKKIGESNPYSPWAANIANEALKGAQA